MILKDKLAAIANIIIGITTSKKDMVARLRRTLKFANRFVQKARAINMANKTPESKLQATARYHAKFEQIPFRVRTDGSDGITRESIAQAAERAGESMNTFIIEAIRQRMARM